MNNKQYKYVTFAKSIRTLEGYIYDAYSVDENIFPL